MIEGAAPTPTVMAQNGWGSYTFVDQSMAIPPGRTITHLGIHAPAGGVHRLRLAQADPAGFYFPPEARVDLTHTVDGFQDAELPAPFTVPAGTWHFACSVLSGSTTRSVDVTAQTIPSIAPNGIVGGFGSVPAVPPMRAAEGDPGDPPVDPEDPPSEPEDPPVDPPSGFTIGIVGQSNAENLASQAGGVLTARYQAVTGQPATLVNLAHDSSPVAFWGPGSAFLNELLATPMSALVYLSGEYEAGTATSDALGYGDAMAGVINAVRAVRGPIPVFVIELFTNPRPYLQTIRDHQRLLADPKSRHGLHDVTLVPCNLVGSIDDGIHLDQPRLESLALDLADTIARRMTAAEIIR